MRIVSKFALLKRISICSSNKRRNGTARLRNIRAVKFFLVVFLDLPWNSHCLQERLTIGEQKLGCQPLFAYLNTLYLERVVEILVFLKQLLITFIIVLTLVFEVVVFVLNIWVLVGNNFRLRVELVLDVLHLPLHLLFALLRLILSLANHLIKHFS